MGWAAWGNWYPKPERNRASRMSCEQGKAHAMLGTRWYMIGDDGFAHVVGMNHGLCGATLRAVPLGGAWEHCPACTEIVQEIERLTT